MATVRTLQDRDSSRKPFLGGWRNTVTGLIYHNACTQTPGGGKTTSRITQTITLVDAITDVVHDRAVQVQFLPDVRDRIIAAAISSFVAPALAKEVEPLRRRDRSSLVNSVVKIQRCYRAHRARVAAAKTRQAISATRRDETNVIEQAAFSTGVDFILNRHPPRTSSDFQTLYNLLDRWRILETERASRTLFRSSKVATCGLILSKEVELLRAIDSVKTVVRLERIERKRRGFLDELSKPVIWRGSQGWPILVDTLRVQCARHYRDMYASLVNEDLPVPERVDLLRGLKHVAGMHTCSHSHELVYLIDQELDLLSRRVDASKLNWLRNRLKLSFLKLARDTLQGDLGSNVLAQINWLDTTQLCRTCSKLLPLEKFPRERRTRSSSCVYCISMRIRREPRIVHEPYETMLREVRHFETRMGCYGGLAFVIGAKIVCRLVNEIWHGRSAISECDDLDELRLTRFRREFEWTPWNSLLLTRTEAAVHREIIEIESFYDPRLLQKFCMKNLQAKMYFKSISGTRRNLVTPSSKD